MRAGDDEMGSFPTLGSGGAGQSGRAASSRLLSGVSAGPKLDGRLPPVDGAKIGSRPAGCDMAGGITGLALGGAAGADTTWLSKFSSPDGSPGIPAGGLALVGSDGCAGFGSTSVAGGAALGRSAGFDGFGWATAAGPDPPIPAGGVALRGTGGCAGFGSSSTSGSSPVPPGGAALVG
jgi:hypothetical protein